MRTRTFPAALVALASVLLAASVLALATSGSKAPVVEANATNAHAPEFVAVCTWSHRASDDPILHPGRPGVSHEHDFFGGTATDASSTATALLGTDSTCQSQPADTAAYWTPTLYDGRDPVEPGRLFAYYRRPAVVGLDPAGIEPYPFGLKMVAGDMHAVAPQSTAIVAWHCGSSDDLSVRPPSCPRGFPLGLHVAFPPCWDGEHLDSADHRSHVAYPIDGSCPATHPVVLPELVVDVAYTFSGDPGELRLASGDVGSGHADFLNAWEQSGLQRLVVDCLQAGTGCGVPIVRSDVVPTS